MKLRTYQEDAVNSVFDDFAAGFHKLLGVASTGAGKTIMFWSIVDRYILENPGARVLILANMQDLIDQAEEKMLEFWMHLHGRVGVVMNSRNASDKQIIIASVQTLNVEGRLASVLDHGVFDLVITDECHEALSDGFTFVYSTVAGVNPAWRHIGVTATPKRADGRGMKELFEKTSFILDIGTLVRMKALVHPKWLGIQTGISVRGIRQVGLDFDQHQLADVFEVDNCFDLVVESHRKYAHGRKAMAFVASVPGAYKLAAKFRKAGYKAIAADAMTGKKEKEEEPEEGKAKIVGFRARQEQEVGRKSRKQIVAEARAGYYDCVINVGLWTKGFDCPVIDCIHMVCPTKHDGAYLQKIGRGMRLYPGKNDVLILDYAPLDKRDLVFAGDVLGMKIRKDAYADVVEGEVFSGFEWDGVDMNYIAGDPTHLVERQLDYMDATGVKWSGGKGRWLTVGLGMGADNKERMLAISPPGETMTLYGLAKEKDQADWGLYPIMSGDSDQVLAKSEEMALKWQNHFMLRKKMAWANQAPSPDIEKYARDLKVFKPGMRKLECDDAITRILALYILGRNGLSVSTDIDAMKFQPDLDN